MSETIEVGDVVAWQNHEDVWRIGVVNDSHVVVYDENCTTWVEDTIRLGATADEALKEAQRREQEAKENYTTKLCSEYHGNLRYGFDKDQQAELATAISAHVAAAAMLDAVLEWKAREKGGEE